MRLFLRMLQFLWCCFSQHFQNILFRFRHRSRSHIHIKPLFLQCMHDISDLRCCKSHGFQLSIMGKYSLRSVIICNLSVVDYDQSLRIFRDIFHTVRYKDNGNSSYFMKLCDLIKDVIASFRIQTRCRFIKDQDLRVHRQNSGNGNSFLLSAGKLKWRFAVVLFLKPYMLQGFLRFHFCLFSG